MSNLLDSSEVDALLDESQRQSDDVSPRQARVLELVLRDFAAELERTLKQQWSAATRVHALPTASALYGKFIESLPESTCLCLVTETDSGATLCLQIPPAMIFEGIERMVGGAGHEIVVPQRHFTPIEIRLVRRILDQLVEHLSIAWHRHAPSSFQIQCWEIDPRQSQIVEGADTVLLGRLQIEVAGRAHCLHVCIPPGAAQLLDGER